MELEGLFPEHLCYPNYRKDKHIQHNVLFKPGESLLGTHVSYHYDLFRYILSVTWVLCWGGGGGGVWSVRDAMAKSNSKS